MENNNKEVTKVLTAELLILLADLADEKALEIRTHLANAIDGIRHGDYLEGRECIVKAQHAFFAGDDICSRCIEAIHTEDDE